MEPMAEPEKVTAEKVTAEAAAPAETISDATNGDATNGGDPAKLAAADNKIVLRILDDCSPDC
jgi:hypothetical protein